MRCAWMHVCAFYAGGEKKNDFILLVKGFGDQKWSKDLGCVHAPHPLPKAKDLGVVTIILLHTWKNLPLVSL